MIRLPYRCLATLVSISLSKPLSCTFAGLKHLRHTINIKLIHHNPVSHRSTLLVAFLACRSLRQHLILLIIPLLAVRKHPVRKSADDWEDKDEHAPQDLVARGAAGLEDLDCGRTSAGGTCE